MSRPPLSPSPPDAADEPAAEAPGRHELVDLVVTDRDWANERAVLFERCELREATFSGATLERVELRGCELAGLRGAEALRGARMPWNDVLANAALFAAVAGIEIV